MALDALHTGSNNYCVNGSQLTLSTSDFAEDAIRIQDPGH